MLFKRYSFIGPKLISSLRGFATSDNSRLLENLTDNLTDMAPLLFVTVKGCAAE